MGAVEILIVYENLDTMRYILRVHGAESNGAENGKQMRNIVLAFAEKLEWLSVFMMPFTFMNFR